MDLSVLSLILFLVATICTMLLPINIGSICIVFTFILKMISDSPISTYFSGFPQKTFLMIFSIMAVSTYMQVNGTMEKLTRILLRRAKGKVGIVPVLMFIIAFFVAALGPGGYATGLIAPIAMSVAFKTKVNPLLMIICVGSGINAAGLSPFAVAGNLAAEATVNFGIGDMRWDLFINGFIGNVLVAGVGYLLFGGLKLWKSGSMEELDLSVEPFNLKQKLTLAGTLALVISVMIFKTDITVACFFILLVFMVFRVAEEKEIWRNLPWTTIFMLFGVSMLVAAVEEFGGIDLFVNIVSQKSSSVTANAFVSLASGFVSSFAASSPTMITFLPLVPGLSEQTGASMLALISSISFSAFVVDCSPFSNTGAMLLANLDKSENYNKVYRGLLLWAIGLVVMAVIISTILFGIIRY